MLVTGHTGFKGTWLTLALEELGVEVAGYSLEAESTSMFNILSREGKINEVFEDIRNKDAFSKFLNKVKPKAIIHLAAQALVLTSYKNPVETFDINCIGTAQLLDAGTQLNCVESILVTTTDKVYQNKNEGRKFSENDPLEGIDPYSASKVATESVIRAWSNLSRIENGPRILTSRAGNVIGGGDRNPNRLLPDLVDGFLKGEVVEIRNPSSTRPWQHVLDPLCGYLLQIEKSEKKNDHSIYNFGPSGEKTVSEVVEEFVRTFGGEISYEFKQNPNNYYESSVLGISSEKAQAELRWKPKYSPNQAVQSTARWWRDVLIEGHQGNEITLNEIQEFLK